MLVERGLNEEWLWEALEHPDQVVEVENQVHYIKAIEAREGRFLKVVVNPSVSPQRVVTLFFDRSLRKK
jgi:hypothetical protein